MFPFFHSFHLFLSFFVSFFLIFFFLLPLSGLISFVFILFSIFRTGEKPHDLKHAPVDDEPSALFHQSLPGIRPRPIRPMCPVTRLRNKIVRIGLTAYLVLYNFKCKYPNCYWCNKKWLGKCKLQTTTFTIRILVQVRRLPRPLWRWVRASFRIPACCKCFTRFWISSYSPIISL